MRCALARERGRKPRPPARAAAGARYLSILSGLFDQYADERLGLELSAHLMYTFWITKHFGFEAHLAGGGLARLGAPPAGDVVPIGEVSVGFAF